MPAAIQRIKRNGKAGDKERSSRMAENTHRTIAKRTVRLAQNLRRHVDAFPLFSDVGKFLKKGSTPQ
jgi:hypothetical protein